jgi:hypothetical protein
MSTYCACGSDWPERFTCAASPSRDSQSPGHVSQPPAQQRDQAHFQIHLLHIHRQRARITITMYQDFTPPNRTGSILLIWIHIISSSNVQHAILSYNVGIFTWGATASGSEAHSWQCRNRCCERATKTHPETHSERQTRTNLDRFHAETPQYRKRCNSCCCLCPSVIGNCTP